MQLQLQVSATPSPTPGFLDKEMNVTCSKEVKETLVTVPFQGVLPEPPSHAWSLSGQE